MGSQRRPMAPSPPLANLHRSPSSSRLQPASGTEHYTVSAEIMVCSIPSAECFCAMILSSNEGVHAEWS